MWICKCRKPQAPSEPRLGSLMFQREAKRALVLNSRLLYLIAPVIRRQLDPLGCQQCDGSCPTGSRTLYTSLQSRLYGLLPAYKRHSLRSFDRWRQDKGVSTRHAQLRLRRQALHAESIPLLSFALVINQTRSILGRHDQASSPSTIVSARRSGRSASK